MEIERDQRIELMAYALWRHSRLRPRRASLDEARALARRIIDYLEECGIEWRRCPPAPLHGSPGPLAERESGDAPQRKDRR